MIKYKDCPFGIITIIIIFITILKRGVFIYSPCRCQSMGNDLEAENDLCKLDFELTVEHKSLILREARPGSATANCLE